MVGKWSFNCFTLWAGKPFNSSTLQLFNPSTLQLFNSSTLQLFNPSTLQPFNSSTLQLFNPSTLQPFNSSTLLLPFLRYPHKLMHLQGYSPLLVFFDVSDDLRDDLFVTTPLRLQEKMTSGRYFAGVFLGPGKVIGCLNNDLQFISKAKHFLQGGGIALGREAYPVKNTLHGMSPGCFKIDGKPFFF